MSDNRVDTNRPEYSWIPFFEELAQRLHEDGWRHRQPEIVAELQRMRREGFRIAPWVDNLTEWIDPFSLIGTIRRVGFDNAISIMESFRLFFAVDAELPIEDPINPSVNPQRSFYFHNVGEDDQTEAHWDLFERVMSTEKPDDDSDLVDLLNLSANIQNVRHARLSGALHWIKPHTYLKTDTIEHLLDTRDYSNFGLNYLDNLARVRLRESRLFPTLNVAEWLNRSIRDAKRVWSMNAGKGNEYREDWLNGDYVGLDWNVKETELNSLRSEDAVRTELAPYNLSNVAVTQFVNFRLRMRKGDVVVLRSEDPGWHHFGILCSDFTYLVRAGVDRDEHLNRKGVIWYSQLIKTEDLNLPGMQALLPVVADKDEVMARIVDAIRGVTQHNRVLIETLDRSYSIDTMLAEGVFLDEDELARIMAQLERKQSLILQGPPGTGKTFLAKRLAYALMGERADERVASVQFHQSYAYEDFVGGYRPGVNEDDQLVFKPQDGAFLKLCERARAASPDDKFVMLIDEINRGNLSRVFGELLMLIEADKRSPEHAVELQHQMADAPVDDGRFFVPPNVYIIGTMNLADRSLTGMNVAMRRRFAFAELRPMFDTTKFKRWLEETARTPKWLRSWITQRMVELNDAIAEDPSLDRQHAIGHSFFCPEEPIETDAEWEAWFRDIVEYQIRPQLEEYWFDDPGKAEREVAAITNGMVTGDADASADEANS